MADNFALGHDIRVKIMKGDVPVTGLEDCVSFDWNPQIVLVEGKHLGQSTNTFNSDTQGFKGSATFNVKKADAIIFVDTIYKRAARKINYETYNIVFYMFNVGVDEYKPQVAEGQESITYKFRDVVFETPKINAGSKDGFVELSFNWACSDAETPPLGT